MTGASSQEPLILAQPERPFWGFGEVFLIAALFIPAVFLGAVITRILAGSLHFDPERGLPQLATEFIGYMVVFAVLKLLFERHGQPLLSSLGWVRQPFHPLHLIYLGVTLAIVVTILGAIVRLPNVPTPFEKLLTDAPSRIAIAIFGVTLGPVIEELLFRGFLQPVLTSVIGVFPGILVTAVVFGAAHLQQNANIWQSGLLITLVGIVLGVVRHVSGSTRASAITHMSYNAMPFLALLAAGGGTPSK